MIQTDRLILRPTDLEDASFVLELLNTKDWIENIGDRNVHTVESACKYIQEKMIDHYKIHGYGNYVMIHKANNKKIGCISLYNRAEMEGIDIGFAMLPDFMGQGFAYEGALAIMNLAKEEFKLKSITAFTIPKNIASQKLIEKLGLKFVKNIIWEETKESLMYYEKKF